MNRPENECKGCGGEIADDVELTEYSGDDFPEYCSDECFSKRPLGTGYSRSDYV